jgi:hypothetical protein
MAEGAFSLFFEWTLSFHSNRGSLTALEFMFWKCHFLFSHFDLANIDQHKEGINAL